MEAYKVIIPEEVFQLLKFEEDGLPGIAVVNSSLKFFEPKEVFSWHCSIIIDFQGLTENGMPTIEENFVVNEFQDQLDSMLKGTDTAKPNALFLARVTFGGTRRLVYRVFDPEVANLQLMGLIDGKEWPREFSFKISLDEDWLLAKQYLRIPVGLRLGERLSSFCQQLRRRVRRIFFD